MRGWVFGLGCGIRGGLRMCSLYLIASEAESGKNQDLLFQVGAVVQAMSKSYIIGADWEMEPEFLPAGWVKAIGVHIRAARKPTCISWACSSEIDYFVVGKAVKMCAMEVEVLDEVPTKPHRAVCMTCMAWDGSQRVQMLRKPKPIPVPRVLGPMRPAPDWGQLSEESGHMQTKEQLDEVPSSFLVKFEQELINDRDFVGQSAYVGRGMDPSFAWRPPPGPCTQDVKTKPGEAHWGWLASRVTE
eukprot:14750071-Heterocapsa_arctica.AAC.1